MRVPSLGLPGNVSPAFWGMVFVEGARGAYFGIWPLWIERLGAEIAIIGLLLGATSFLRMFIVGPSASLADRFGTRNILLVTRLGVILALLISLLSTNWLQLLPVIVLLAIGEVVYPLIQAYVLQQSSEDQGMRAFTMVLNVGSSTGLAVAPLVSGVVVALFDMRAAFALAIAFTCLAILSLSRLEADRAPARAVDDAPRSSYRTALAQPTVLVLLILLGAMVFTLSLGSSLIPTFVEDVRGVDPAGIAFLSALPAAGTVIFGLLVARSRAIQQQPFIGVVAGMLQVVFCVALFHQFGHPAILALAFFLRGGVYSSWTMMIGTIGKSSRPADRARSFAMSEIVGGVFFALGPVVAGLLYAQRPSLPFESAFLLIAAMIPVIWFVQSRLLRRPDSVSSGSIGVRLGSSGEQAQTESRLEIPPLASPVDDLATSG